MNKRISRSESIKGKKIWSSVNKAASSCPTWVRSQVSDAAESAAQRVQILENCVNKRIKELAHQAGLYYYPRGTCCMDEMFPRHFNVAEADEAYEKFAELIVKECAAIVSDAVDRREPASTYVSKILELRNEIF